jgi:cytochrome c-type biogenesis protein
MKGAIMFNISSYTAFINGVITFFSPCVLPLLPLYFSYLAGEAVTTNQHQSKKIRLFVNTIGFILGISMLNLLIGFGAKLIADYLIQSKEVIRIFGGVFMIMFGLYFISGKTIALFEKEKKFVMTKYSPTFIKSTLLGFTFSLGWSACNGPIVASISLIASFQKDYLRAGGLMLVYSAGFAIPFLIAALLAGFFIEHFKMITQHVNKIKIVSGLVLIMMGLLMLFDKVQWLTVSVN